MLSFKKISEHAKDFMKESIDSGTDYHKLVVEKLCSTYSSDEAYVLNSANSCLITICKSIPDSVLVCDMGGWNGFIKSCELFDKRIEYFKTEDGIINIQDLSNYLDCNRVSSMYITSLAGYSAVQDIGEIRRLCDLHNILLIIDISPSVGDEKIAQHADILVASTGSPKIVNIENGGFIINKTEKIELNNHLIKSLKADNITCAGIYNELDNAEKTLTKTVEMNKYLKKKLLKEGLNIAHPESFGLNTIILSESKSKAKKLAYNIRKKLDLDGNIITVGPNYNRIKKPSVIIEIKNLNINETTHDDMDYLVKIILESKRELEMLS